MLARAKEGRCHCHARASGCPRRREWRRIGLFVLLFGGDLGPLRPG